ncbi:integrase [Spirosoma sp. LMG 31448]|nr:integrase [Spirosoma utsteinense]
MLRCIVTGPSGKSFKARMLYKVKPMYWDKKKSEVKSSYPLYISINKKLTTALNNAKQRVFDLQRQGLPIDPDEIVQSNEVVVSKGVGFLDHARAYVAKCDQKGLIHTAEKYGGHVSKLAEYIGAGKDVLLTAVDENWLLGWSAWLKDNGTRSANTLHRRMAFINTLFRDAIRRGLVSTNPMAFLEFKEQRVRKPKLTLEQLNTLEALPLEGREADARNTFLLQFFAYGTRISDALTWKKSDVRQDGPVWYLHYTSMKTKDLIDVRLNDRAAALVKHYLDTVPGPYLLPWLASYERLPSHSDTEDLKRLLPLVESKTTMVNWLLKKVAKKAEFPEHIKLTSHIARHTFATLADAKVSDKRKISAALGHSKFATTEAYLSELRQSDVNDAMDAVFD